MVAIIKVPGTMFQQRAITASQSEPQEEHSLNINDSEPAENHNPPPHPVEGGINGSIGQVWQCTGFTVGNPPEEDVPDAETDYDYFPEAEDQPDTIEVDVDGDGEADLEVTDEADIPEDGVIIEDGDTPEVDEDGEADVNEDGDVIPDAEDGEVSGPCNNAPFVDPIPAYPSIGDVAVELNPVLNWADAVDVDPGDSIASYNLIVSANPDLSSPIINVTDLPASEYPVPAGVLADVTTYYWATEAVDTCGRTTTSPIWNFTTIRTCLPYTFTDPTDLSLPEDPSAWTYRYEGNVYPGAAPASGSWSQNGAAGTILLGSEGPVTFLGINTLGSNGSRYYWNSPGFDNSRGSVAEIGVRFNGQDDSTPPSPTGFQFMSLDGVRQTSLAFFPDRVCEMTMGCYMLDTTVFRQYRVEFSGIDVRLYVDGSLALDGPGMLTTPTTENRIYMGDMPLDADSSVDIDYVYASNLDDRIPYVSPGSYESAPYDTGAAANGHEGARIDWVPASAAGTVTLAVRAADDLTALASAPWTAELTDNPATIPAGVVGRHLQWRVTLTAPEPTTTPVVDDVTVTRTCP